MSEPVKIGLVGCGLIARREHLPAYAASPDAIVTAVASGHRENAEAVAKEFDAGHVHHDWESLVVDPEVEAVDICTPNALHAPIAIAAARAGKHVLVEKPMAVSVADADAMIAAADEAHVTLMVAHNLRFLNIFEAVKQVLDDGVIGSPLAARGCFGHGGPDETWAGGIGPEWFFDPDQAGGGALIDMGVHIIDTLRWLLGRRVEAVVAMTTRARKPTAFDDNAFALLRFEGPLIASVQTSWTARPFPDYELVIHGERGFVAVGKSERTLVQVMVQGDEGPVEVAVEIPAESRYRNPYVHFARVVRGLEPPIVDGREGRDTLAVALAAYQSAASGHVALPA